LFVLGLFDSVASWTFQRAGENRGGMRRIRNRRMRWLYSGGMFNLSCAHVRVYAPSSHETSAHEKTWSAHKCFFQKSSSHIIISYTSFQIQISSGKMLHKRNFLRTQTLKKSDGTLVAVNTTNKTVPVTCTIYR